MKFFLVIFALALYSNVQPTDQKCVESPFCKETLCNSTLQLVKYNISDIAKLNVVYPSFSFYHNDGKCSKAVNSGGTPLKLKQADGSDQEWSQQDKCNLNVFSNGTDDTFGMLFIKDYEFCIGYCDTDGKPIFGCFSEQPSPSENLTKFVATIPNEMKANFTKIDNSVCEESD